MDTKNLEAKCACGSHMLKQKKTRWGKLTWSVFQKADETHGVRACFDLSKPNEVIATRYEDDPLNKEVK